MKLVCNRFAIVPHMCNECRQYIWLESYRRADVWINSCGHFIKENICKDCLPKFIISADLSNSSDFTGGIENEHV